tara:strand:- start:118 stop:411 length:294 start_codon:yes stop_codon:yes gene_type:complete
MTEVKQVQKGKGQENKIDLLIIVNGTPTTVEANVNAPLKTAVEKALSDTGNTGRPITDWQLKWNDQVLDLDKKIKEFEFPEGAELFLSLKAGVGGMQ